MPASVRSELDIPSALDGLILECLAKDPASRPVGAAVLSERLAATVPDDAWTQEASHAWWERHRGSLIESPAAPHDALQRDEEAADAPDSHPRCWPRLDRQPFS